MAKQNKKGPVGHQYNPRPISDRVNTTIQPREPLYKSGYNPSPISRQWKPQAQPPGGQKPSNKKSDK